MSNSSNSSGNRSTTEVAGIASEAHFIVLAVLIIALNLCVILVVWTKPLLHKWQNYLLVSLAFSDLGTGLFGLPVALVCSLDISSRGCIFCSVSYTFTKFISISTILHLLTVTYERFVFIVYPFYHERVSGKHIRFKLVLVAIWSISLTVAVVPFTWIDSEKCVGDEENAKHWLVYTATTLILFLVLPMILFIFAFVSMFLVARSHIHKLERLMARVPGSENPTALNASLRKEARVALIFGLMWIIFVICWGPYFAVNILDEMAKVETDLPETFVEAANVLRFLTSLLNPLLYSFAKKDFCEALRRTCLGRSNIARQCCLPYDRRCTARHEVPLHSTARGLSESPNHALITQLSTV